MTNTHDPELDTVRPLIKGKVENKDVIVFLDSGSPENIINAEFYLSVFKHIPLFIKHSRLALRDIQGKEIQTLGYCRLKLEIGNKMINEVFSVVNDLKLLGNVLIGHPTMARNNIVLNPRCKCAFIYNYPIPYVTMNSKNCNHNFHCQRVLRQEDGITSQCTNKVKVAGSTPHVELSSLLKNNQIATISNRRKIIVPPQSLHIVKCKVKSGYNGKFCVSLPETTMVKGLSLEPGLFQIDKNSLYIQISNDRAGDLILDKGTQICHIEIYDKEIRIEDDLPENIVGLIGEKTSDIDKLRDRRDRIISQISNTDYPAYFDRLINILMKYENVIALKGDNLGKTNVITHHINVPKNISPIYVPCYRLAHSQKEKASESIKEMLKQGIITESNSPWNSPMLVVPKRDGSYRIVIDYRKLNSLTATDPYPVPSLRDLISSIGENTVFSTLDMLQGYLQVPLDEQSKPLTGFSSSLGHFEFTRMPFGLKSSPITFCRLVDQVFRGLIGTACIIYIDDIVILGKTIEDHLNNLELVLQRLQKAGLKIKISKCSFLKKEVEYLGHTLTQTGVKVNQEKIRAIHSYPTPTNAKAIKSFLGLASFYRKFIKDFAHIASPMSDLLKENTPFEWGEKQNSAFLELKDKLSNPPVLTYPNFDKEFYLYCDASAIGIGSVLMQHNDKNQLQPIAYYSRKLNKAEKEYSVTDKEALAVIASLKHFRYIIFGYKIQVYTDHAAITEIFKNPQLSGKRARWHLIACEYDITLHYIPGSKNIIADALSRHISCINSSEILSTDLISFYQDADPKLGDIKRYLKSLNNFDSDSTLPNYCIPLNELKVIDNLLTRSISHTQADMPDRISTQVIIPKVLVNTVINHIHDKRAHPGRDETIRQARLNYFWPSMVSDISLYVSRCKKCASYKGHAKGPNPIQLYPVPQLPFQRCHIDLLSNLSESHKGYKHIFLIVDALTRFTVLYPLKTKSAKECTERLLDFFLTYTAPEVIVSDCGREFINQVMESLCKYYNVNKVNVLPYMPASNGLAERQIQKLINVMRNVIDHNDRDWDSHILTYQHLLNTSVHQSIKNSPFHALYGFDSRNPLEKYPSSFLDPNNENPIINHIKNAKIRHNLLAMKLQESNLVMQRKQHDRARGDQFNVGDLVYKKRDYIPGPNYKLAPKFMGPYQVMKIMGPNKYEIKDVETEELILVHADKLKRYQADKVNMEDDDLADDNNIRPRPQHLRNIPRINYAEG